MVNKETNLISRGYQSSSRWHRPCSYAMSNHAERSKAHEIQITLDDSGGGISLRNDPAE
jgi:hypothetical protein